MITHGLASSAGCSAAVSMACAASNGKNNRVAAIERIISPALLRVTQFERAGDARRPANVRSVGPGGAPGSCRWSRVRHDRGHRRQRQTTHGTRRRDALHGCGKGTTAGLNRARQRKRRRASRRLGRDYIDQRMKLLLRPMTVSSTYLEPWWFCGEKSIVKSPTSNFCKLSSAFTSFSAVGFGPARQSPSTSTLAETKPCMLAYDGATRGYALSTERNSFAARVETLYG